MQGLFLTKKLTAETQISDTHTLYFNEAGLTTTKTEI